MPLKSYTNTSGYMECIHVIFYFTTTMHIATSVSGYAIKIMAKQDPILKSS